MAPYEGRRMTPSVDAGPRCDRDEPWGKSPGSAEERQFPQGPQPRRLEFARALRILREVLHGLRAFHFVGPCVTVFGSARFGEHDPYYAMAHEVGAHLARAGFTVLTGGGSGIMEAANRADPN